MKSQLGIFSKTTFMVAALCLLPVFFQNCQGFKALPLSQDLASSSGEPAILSQGKKLYAANCAACHGALEATQRYGRTSSQITTALSGVAQMQFLKPKLSADQINSIAVALNFDPTQIACTISSVGKSSIRRLSTTEIKYSLIDLLGARTTVLDGVDADGAGPSGFSNDGSGLVMGYVMLGKLLTAVGAAVDGALDAQTPALLQCPNGVQDDACAKSKITTFAAQAYRRPLNTAEIEALFAVYSANKSFGFKTGLSLSLQAALMSPNFLYLRLSSGSATTKGKSLTNYEFAARLSYFLWSSVPDAQLTTLAAQGTLKTPAVLRAQISRMLKDPKADRFATTLFGEWLKYARVLDSNQIIRNGMNDQLRMDMYNETKLFTASLIQDDKSLMSLVNADYSYLNANLANHYGVGGVTSSAFTRVPLANTGRVGVLSNASVLTVYADTADSTPVGRGKFMLDKILCDSPPPRPDNIVIPDLASAAGSTLTVKERLSQHAANPQCASCHSQMDPIGLAFEHFDQLGTFRTKYSNGLTVDASGSLYDQSFVDYPELSRILVKQPRIRSCLASKVLAYALNRGVGQDERCVSNVLAAIAVQDTSTFSDLIYQIATHDVFNFNSTDSN